MIIKTDSKEVSRYIRQLPNTQVTEEGRKDFLETAYLIYVHTKSVATYLAALVAIIKFIKSEKENSQSKTTIKIKPSECTPEIVEIIKASKGVVDIKIED